jgi:leucyl-tRNA synthetase
LISSVFLAFPGLINWQKRIWITIHDLQQARDTVEKNFVQTPEFLEEEAKMFDARNYYVSGATFNYKYSHQLSVGISKMQGLTNSIRVSTDSIGMC